MPVYVVERYLSGWSPTEIESLVDQLRDRRRELGDRHVHHLGSIVLPGEETFLCVFEGSDADQVRHANLGVGLPVDRVVPGALIGGLSGDP